jgi:biotin-dependent carboxylase-like uncharacterized protein
VSVASIQIVKPGLLTTVQDRGRFGWEAYGIPRGGALDVYAYTWANRLAGNPPDAAVLQATLLGPTLAVSEDCWIATTGVETVSVDGSPYPSWAGFWVRKGASVALEKISAARAYVAVHGGIAVELVLGSRSTDLESHFGGYQGRGLRAGDVVPVGEADVLTHGRWESLRHPSPPVLDYPLSIRAVPGPRDDEFSPEAITAFFGEEHRVSSQSNHVGLRLEGPAIPTPSRGTRISEPMPVGGIQITPRGQPIVLLNARGTIGGYPLIATVISTDVWTLGQARPGDRVRFRRVAVEEAQAIAREAHAGLSVDAVRRPLPLTDEPEEYLF